MKCKRLEALLLTLLFLAGLAIPACGYEPEEPVGQNPILLRRDMGDGLKNAENQACSLGCAAADAARLAAGTELAILNGGELGGDLAAGETTWAEIQAVLPSDYPLARVTVTAEELWQMLEWGVSRTVLDEQLKIDREASCFEGFPQVSGFRFTYDMSAPMGERVYSVTLDSSEELDRTDGEREFTLCATDYMLSGGYGYPVPERPVQTLELTCAEAMAAALAADALNPDDYEQIDRVTVIGCGDYNLMSTSPKVVLVLLAVLVLIKISLNLCRKMKFQRS